MIRDDAAYKKLTIAVNKMTEKAQALLGFFLMLKCSETDNLSVVVRIVANEGTPPVLEYCPARIMSLNDSLLGSFVYMECLRLALHHCDKRKKDPADIYKLASDLIVSEYARYVLDLDEGDNERILTQLFPSVWSYSEILSQHGFDIEHDLYLERVFEILMEHQSEVRSIRDEQKKQADEESDNDNEEECDTDGGGNGDSADDGNSPQKQGDETTEDDAEEGEEDPGSGVGGGRNGVDRDQNSGSDGKDDGVDPTDPTGSVQDGHGRSEYDAAREYFSNAESVVKDWNGDDNVTNNVRMESRMAESNHLFDHMHNNVMKMIKRANARRSNVKALFKHFIGSVSTEDRIETRSRRNRRFGMPFCGFKLNTRPSIILCLDVSGSMWSVLDKCIEFLQSVSQEVDIDICHWDTICGKPRKTTRRDDLENVTGGGGTNPECIMERAYKEHWSYNGIIVITDCIFEWPKPSKFRNIMIVRVGEFAEFPPWCLYQVDFKEIAKEIN